MRQKFKLDESISSPQDLRALIVEVHDYARWFSHSAIKRQLHVDRRQSTPQPAISPVTLATIKNWCEDKNLSRQDLDHLIDTLESYADKAPVLTITLAAAPTSGFKKQLVSWCRTNISPSVLINFEFNSTLLGGMVVRFGSRVFDWSFRRAILSNMNTFPGLLRAEGEPMHTEANNV